MIRTLAVTAILCICNSVIGQDLKNHQVCDKNNKYHIYWTVEDQNITIQLEVENKGWVGFGLNQKPIMAGADIVIGWVYPNGTAVFHDRNGQGFFEPLIDTEQNYALLDARENATHTILRFTRLLNTCDKNDTIINEDTIRFLCTWHPDDPPQITGFPGHGHDRVVTKQVYLLNPQPEPVPITNDIVIWELRMPNITIPAQRTTYWCKFFEMPDYDDALDYIGFTIELTPGNEEIVHHFMFFACTVNVSQYEEQVKQDGFQCVTEDTLAPPMDCQPAVAIWAIGSKGQMLPDGIGIPFGKKSNGSHIFLLQLHYNNINQTAGIKDSSGLNAYLTKKRTPTKAAVLQFYGTIDYTTIIPPKQPSFKWTTYCPSECTQRAFPPAGINIFDVAQHAHLRGRKIHLRQFRANQELKPIAYDDNYDFDYQEMRRLPKPVQVLPGDLLMAECTYDSMDENMTVVGGYSTKQEMCMIYATYYPASGLSLCIGGPSYEETGDYYGVKIGPDNLHIESPPEHFNKSMFDFVLGYDWSKVSQEKLNKMIAMQFNETKNMTCQYTPDSEGISVHPVVYPDETTFYMAPDVCTDSMVASVKPNSYQPPQPPQSYETNPKPQQSYEKEPPKPQESYEKEPPKPQESYEKETPKPQESYEETTPAPPQESYEETTPAPQESYEETTPAPPQESYEETTPAPQESYEETTPAPQESYEETTPAPPQESYEETTPAPQESYEETTPAPPQESYEEETTPKQAYY